jgi:methylmalonyl-CoA/ethylmalonyl-CoA epimerase
MNDPTFDHVGILVEDFGRLRELAVRLGIDLGEPEPEPELGIEVLWAHAGAVALEFIRPLHDGSRAAAALRAGQGGVHHVAFAVDALGPTLATLADSGFGTRAGDPRAGSRGSLIAFLDAATAGGCLVELVEHQ